MSKSSPKGTGVGLTFDKDVTTDVGDRGRFWGWDDGMKRKKDSLVSFLATGSTSCVSISSPADSRISVEGRHDGSRSEVRENKTAFNSSYLLPILIDAGKHRWWSLSRFCQLDTRRLFSLTFDAHMNIQLYACVITYEINNDGALQTTAVTMSVP
jgi:hypothetical protein